MTVNHRITTILLVVLLVAVASGSAIAQALLPSWNDGPAKKAILEFVAAVTDANGKDYVEPAERIAVFDNDGTLWVEQPIYTQVRFIFDRVRELAPQHSEWKTTQPFTALLAGDMKTVAASGEKGLLDMVLATHTGMTAEQFTSRVTEWMVVFQNCTSTGKYAMLMEESGCEQFEVFQSVVNPDKLTLPATSWPSACSADGLVYGGAKMSFLFLIPSVDPLCQSTRRV